MRWHYTLLFTTTLLLAQPLIAKECTPWQDSFSTRTDLIIGTLSIRPGDVFDVSKKDENTRLHVWTNKLHIETRESTIQQQLLFKSGDSFQPRLLSESERLLRNNVYLKDVKITPVELCDTKVNIHIYSNDKWTLTSGLSFGRSGGNNKSGVEIEEHNLFGLGKSLSLSYNQSSERDSVLLGYKDPQLFGSRKRLFAAIQDNSDGAAHELDLGLPFYALDSRYAWGMNTFHSEQENSLYQQGKVVSKVNQDKDQHSLFYGWSKGLQGNHVARFKAGWQYRQNNFSDSATQSTDSLTITESYPWLAYEYTEDKFIKKTNFKTMGQIEDISLSKTFISSMGLLQKQFGSDNNYLRLSSHYSEGYELTDNDLGFINFNISTYLGNGLLEGEQVSLKGEWYTFNESGNNLYFSGQITEKSNLLPSEQILLGGQTGLRGYPKAYQAGNKSIAVTAEKRFHFNWYPLRVAKFGAVAFADAGTAWGGDNESNLLADIGIGLRIVPTRSSSAKTLHLDFAVPLSDRSNVDNFQLLIRTSNSF